MKWAAENLCACLSMCSVASWLMGDPLSFAVMVCDAPIFGKSGGAATQLVPGSEAVTLSCACSTLSPYEISQESLWTRSRY